MMGWIFAIFILLVFVLIAFAIYYGMREKKSAEQFTQKIENGYLTNLVWDDISDNAEKGIYVCDIDFFNTRVEITYYCLGNQYDSVRNDFTYKWVRYVGQNNSHVALTREIMTNSGLSKEEALVLAGVLARRLGKDYCVKNYGVDYSLEVSLHKINLPWNSSNW